MSGLISFLFGFECTLKVHMLKAQTKSHSMREHHGPLEIRAELDVLRVIDSVSSEGIVEYRPLTPTSLFMQ